MNRQPFIISYYLTRAPSCEQCPYHEIENLDDIDGKDDVWSEIECSEQQPDDMSILVAWFACYNETQKQAKYSAVSHCTTKRPRNG